MGLDATLREMQSLDPCSAGVDLQEMATALSRSDDAKMKMEIALDGRDHIRGFAIRGEFGPMEMDMDAVVGSYSRDLKVDIPTQGIHDMTSTLVGALGGLEQR